MGKVPARFQPRAEDEIFALTPQACQALEEQGIPYRTPPDLGTEDQMREREEAYFKEQMDWFHQLDRMLLKRLPELESGSVSPSFLYGYPLKNLLDNWFIRGTECAALLGSDVGRVTFTGEKGVYSRLLSSLCGEQGIPYEENLLVPDPHPAPRYRLLRFLLHSFRRGSWIALGWKEGDPSLKANRLGLLFLETDYDLNDLLNSAIHKKHRCLIRKGSRILDLSRGGKTVLSVPGNRKPVKPWDQISEELFETSSPLWSWIRNGWGLPLEKLLAQPLKEWVRTELAQMIPLVGEFRGLYRREGIDFVIASAITSNPSTAAVAACEREGKPQSVLISHGDGGEIKLAWDLFELAPYRHYFVSNSELAKYFDQRRSSCSFPTAQIHVGSYRWRRYAQLRKRPWLRLEHQEDHLTLNVSRTPFPVPSGKPIVVVPFCQPETDTRYLNPLSYSETGYYRLQCRLLKVFAEFPDYTFVLKLFPPESSKTSVVGRALAHLGIQNVYISSSSFPHWLPWADRVLLDYPSTPLYETARAGVPFHLLYSVRKCPIRPEVMKQFAGFLTPFSTLEEAAQGVRRFLRSPAPKPLRIQAEGEEILFQLVGLRKDRILISSPRALRKSALSALRGIRWCYLGTRCAARATLEARLGSANRLPLAAGLQEAADRLRKPFLDFVAEVGSCQKDLLSWWCSRFSWKMWTASDLFLLTVYLSLAEDWVKKALSRRQSLLLIVEDPWLLRQLRENLTGKGNSVDFLGVKSLRWEKLKVVFAGSARRAKWLWKTLWDRWNQWRVWPKQPLENPQEPSAALFSVPMAGSFQAGRQWRDPHLPRVHRWLTEAGFRVFRFSPLDYPGYERELAQRADYFHPLILWATPAGIWRSLKTRWRPRWPDRMEVAGLNVRRLAEREAWLEAGRASLSGYRLFYECLRNRLATGNWRWLIFFYENQPWEKLAVLCARERGIRVAGIQTAILSPEYLPVLLGKAEESVAPLPDVICTSGPYAHRLLSEWGNPPHRLKLCGALRYPGLAGEAHSNGNGVLHRVPRSEILVVLPVHPPMAEHLLRALGAAFPDGGASEGLRFHIRPHPLCPISRSHVRIPAQILSSQFGNIQQALNGCGLVLFAGSTVGFEAVHSGRPVLRYRPDVLPDIDSVYGPVIPVCGDTDLRHKLLRLVREGFSEQEWQAARNVVSDFFSTPEPARLLDLFQSGTPPASLPPERRPLLIRRIPHSQESREGFLPLDRNERTSDFSPQVMEEIRRLVTSFGLRAYPEPEAFYRQLAQWLGVPREMLLLSGGADGAFRMIFDAFVRPGDEVVHAVPSYGMFPVYCELAGAASRPAAFKEDLTLPLEKILEAISPQTKLVVLANPNQPIERVYNEDECRQILEWCRRSGALLVMDEAYHHFCDLTALPLLKQHENLVVVRTFSKAFGMAGLRLGFLASSKENVRRIEQFRPMYEAHSVALAVGGYLLKNDHLMREYVAQVRESRRFLLDALKSLQISGHGKWGNSILAELPQKIRAVEVTARLKERGFLVRAETTPPLSNHLRITLGTVGQTQRFFSAFEDLMAAQSPQAGASAVTA